MNCFINFKKLFTRPVFFILLITGFFSCENHHYDSDKRQIIAKDEIKSKLHKIRAFNVTGFNEDTLKNSSDSNFKFQIRYTLDIVFEDSNKIEQQKKGIVMFTPDGQSMISSQITDR